MLGKHAVDVLSVTQVRLAKRAPPNRIFVPRAEIVDHDRGMPVLGEHPGGVASDKAGTAGDEYAHDSYFL